MQEKIPRHLKEASILADMILRALALADIFHVESLETAVAYLENRLLGEDETAEKLIDLYISYLKEILKKSENQ